MDPFISCSHGGPPHALFWDFYIVSVMLNFMCQLDGATRSPDIMSNIILVMPVRVFVDGIDIQY